MHSALVRTSITIGLLSVVSCIGPTAPATQAASKYPLHNPDGSIGTIIAGATCDGVLWLADTERRIYRVNLRTGDVLPPFDTDDLLPMAVAADCARSRLWVIAPAKGRRVTAAALDLNTGERVTQFAMAATCLPMSATLAGDELFIAGECLDDAVDAGKPDAASYYANRQIGVRLNVLTGEMHTGLDPYEQACSGAGACVGGSIAVAADAIYAALPVSRRIGVYSRSGTLLRTLPVTSPAFRSTGTALPITASSEDRVRWLAGNTALHSVFTAQPGILVVHQLVELPVGWTMSSATRPQFRAWASMFSADGAAVRVDMPLPELPVAWDGESLFVIDYGPRGRQGAHEQVSVARVPIVD